MRMKLIVALLLAWPLSLPAATRMETLMVPMRDGVKLSTDVYLPGEGRFPVIVVRTPYNKDGIKSQCGYFAEHGYGCVAQDVRGRFRSEGEFYAFVNEGLDGYDTIEWAGAQPWSDGKVGTFGGSYLAWDQYFASMYSPPHLVAMFALVGGTAFYDEYAYPGGTPNLGWPVWILNSARTSRQSERLDTIMKSGMMDWLKLSPAEREKTFDGFPAQKKMYRDFYAHPTFDSYWKQRGFWTAGYYGEMKDVPVFFVTGWYDYFGNGAIDVFRSLSARQKAPKKLLVGPWPHGTGGTVCGDASFGEMAAADQRALAVDWFDHWMKGRSFTGISEQTVRYFRMGGGDGSKTSDGKMNHGGAWKTAASYPLPGAGQLNYYLHGSRALSKQSPAAASPSRYRFVASDPAPTIGGRYNIGNTPMCPQDQRPLDSRKDILSFTSSALAEPLDVTGRPRVRLWVSSDAPSTDFTAKLIDVYPSGYAMHIADGQLRIQPTGKEITEVVIDLGYTSSLFTAGHRLRVDISSSNYPKFETNPHNANNVVYHEPAHPSRIELPTLKP